MEPNRNFVAEESMTIKVGSVEKNVIVYFMSDLIIIAERINSSVQNCEEYHEIARLNLNKNSSVKGLPDNL